MSSPVNSLIFAAMMARGLGLRRVPGRRRSRCRGLGGLV